MKSELSCSGAVVVAGGESKRMGRAKAWLDVDGAPLLRRIVDVLCGCQLEVVVVAAAGQRLPPLPHQVVRLDDPDSLVYQGPLVGLVPGLVHLQRHHVASAYLSACDALMLRGSYVEWLFTRLAAQPEVEMVAPQALDGSDRVNVLASVVRIEPTLAAARTLVDSGERSLQALARTLRCDAVPLDELSSIDALEPCNTPEQWQRLRARVSQRERSRDKPD